MLFEHRYAGSSGVSQGDASTAMSFAPDTLRQPTYFRGNVAKQIEFREAISALHDVVTSDLRFIPKDRAAYLAWREQQSYVDLAQLTASQQRISAEVAELQRELAELEARPSNRRASFYAAQRKYFDYLYNRDKELWFKLDPVITVHPDQVFFECFSRDESSYGRLAASYEVFEELGERACGTTNIDYSEKLYGEFQKIRSYKTTTLDVDPGGFNVETSMEDQYREVKIDLPDSWGARLPPGVVGPPRCRRTSSSCTRWTCTTCASSCGATRSCSGRARSASSSRPARPSRSSSTRGARSSTARARATSSRAPAAPPRSACGAAAGCSSSSGSCRAPAACGCSSSGPACPRSGSWTSATSRSRSASPAGRTTTGPRPATSISWPRARTWTRSPRRACSTSSAAPGSPRPRSWPRAPGSPRRSSRRRSPAGCRPAGAIFDLDRGVYRKRELTREPLPLEQLRFANPREEAAAKMLQRAKISVDRADTVEGGLRLSGRIKDGSRMFAPDMTFDADRRLVSGECGCDYFIRNRLHKGPCEHMLALRAAHRRGISDRITFEVAGSLRAPAAREVVLDREAFQAAHRKAILRAAELRAGGRHSDALRELERVARLAPPDSDDHARIQEVIAEAHLELGAYQSARSAADQALRRLPASAIALLVKRDALVQLDELHAAIQTARALAGVENTADRWSELVRLCDQVDDWNAMYQFAQEGLRSHPRAPRLVAALETAARRGAEITAPPSGAPSGDAPKSWWRRTIGKITGRHPAVTEATVAAAAVDAQVAAIADELERRADVTDRRTLLQELRTAHAAAEQLEGKVTAMVRVIRQSRAISNRPSDKVLASLLRRLLA